MNTNQIARNFLKALVSLEESRYNQAEQSLQSINIVIDNSMELNPKVCTRLLSALCSTSHSFHKKMAKKQIEVVTASTTSKSQASSVSVPEHILISIIETIQKLSMKYKKLIQMQNNSEAYTVALETCLNLIEIAQKEFAVAAMRLICFIVEFLSGNHSDLLMSIIPGIASRMFHLLLNQYKQTKYSRVKCLALQCLQLVICRAYAVASIGKQSKNTELFNLPTFFNKKVKRLQQQSTLKIDRADSSSQNVSRFNVQISIFLATFTNNLETLGMDNKQLQIMNFVSRLLLCDGIRQSEVILPQLYKLGFKVGMRLDTFNEDSPYLRRSVFNHLWQDFQKQLVQLGSPHASSKQQIHRLNFLSRISECIGAQEEHTLYDKSQILLKGVLNSVKCKVNLKVRLTLNSTIIPLEKMTPDSIYSQEVMRSLESSYESVKVLHMLNSFPVLLTEESILKRLESFLGDSIKGLIRQHWIKELLRMMEQNSFDTTISIKQLQTHISIVYLIVSLLRSHVLNSTDYKLSQKFFQVFCKSKSLLKLKVTYEEEELLILLSTQALNLVYGHLQNSSAERALTKLNRKIQYVEILLGLLNQSIYSVTLCCQIYLLNLCSENGSNLCQLLTPLVPTIVQRNKLYLELISTCLRLTIPQLSKEFCSKIADDYHLLSKTNQIIFTVLPKLTTNQIRRCLLALHDQDWMQGLENSYLYLNNQAMENETLTQDPSIKNANFNPDDQLNVRISNTLGVVVLELSTRWQAQVQGRKAGKAYDLLSKIFEANHTLVYFKTVKAEEELIPSTIQLLKKLMETIQSTGIAMTVVKALTFWKSYFIKYSKSTAHTNRKGLLDVMEKIGRKIRMEMHLRIEGEFSNFKNLKQIENMVSAIEQMIINPNSTNQ